MSKIIPPFLNAVALGKYGDVKANLNPDQLTFSVPLYEIRLNDYLFPISLDHLSIKI